MIQQNRHQMEKHIQMATKIHYVQKIWLSDGKSNLNHKYSWNMFKQKRMKEWNEIIMRLDRGAAVFSVQAYNAKAALTYNWLHFLLLFRLFRFMCLVKCCASLLIASHHQLTVLCLCSGNESSGAQFLISFELLVSCGVYMIYIINLLLEIFQMPKLIKNKRKEKELGCRQIAPQQKLLYLTFGTFLFCKYNNQICVYFYTFFKYPVTFLSHFYTSSYE